MLDGFHDLSPLPAAEQALRLGVLRQETSLQPIDYAKPAIFTALVCLAAEQHRLLVNVPALCADLPTLQQLVLELARAYAPDDPHPASTPQKVPVQYADFAQWQHELLAADSPGRRFWRHRLSPGFFQGRLPFQEGGEEMHFIPAVLRGRVGIPSPLPKGREGVGGVLLACWIALLARHSGSRKGMIGLLLDGRNDEVEGACGAYAKVVPLLYQVDALIPFGEWVKEMHQTVLAARRWQDYFVWKNEAGRPDASPLYCPASFAYRSAPKLQRAGPVSFVLTQQSACIDRFKLNLVVVEKGDTLTLELHYDSTCFSTHAIACLLEQLETLTEYALRTPNTTIAELKLASDGGRRRQVGYVPRTVHQRLWRTLHQPFEAQAAKTPLAPAASCDGCTLSYGDLNAQANQLAHYLQMRGIGPEDRIGLYLGRSLDMVIGILGVLKAGAAYVPLDPSYPRERLAYMLEDAGITLVLTQRTLISNLPPSTAPVVCLGRDRCLFASLSIAAPEVKTTADNLAYVIYTSGSTGKPKGVAISHRNAVHSTEVRLDYYRDPVGTFLLVSSFAFDSSVAGIFWTLSQGGCLCLVPEALLHDPSALADLIKQQQVSHLLGLPSFYSLLLEHLPAARLGSLRTVIVAGESCPREVVQRHHALLPAVQLCNEYGPTEGTVWCSVYESVANRRAPSIPIGRPIANMQICLLDQRLEPVPIGISGEIYIGGEGLARGYLGQPALTAERFIPDPFGSSGSRLYRTGDLARYWPDGNIEFLGRADQQVKIRGFRVELGEIEAALRACPEIDEAAVMAQQGEGGQQRLIAYVGGRQSKGTSHQGLREALLERLPDFMIPAQFVILDKLPRLPNGKVDRKSLPAAENTEALSSRYAPPGNAIEQLLARLWAGLLRIERVGIQDNFFELGGDSILSMQLVSRARKAGLKLTARQLFEHQTIAALAPRVERLEKAQAFELPLCPVGGEVPLTPIQRWFFEQDFQNPEHWAHAVLLRLTEAIDGAALEAAAAQVIRHHDALRMQFIKGGDGWRQMALAQVRGTSLEQVDLRHVPEREQRAVIEQTAKIKTAIDIGRGLMLRVIWFDRGAPGYLLVVIHHLVADGLSWRILLEDLHTAYQQLAEGKPVVLPAKTASFQQWATRLQAHARSEQVRQEASYWLDPRRQGIEPLPVDNPDGDNTEAATEVFRVTLNETDTQALLREVPPVYRTHIDDVLLTALALTLCRWNRSRAVLIDLDRHGREAVFDDIDVSRTVGWFTSVFPMLLSVDPDTDLGATVKSVKEQLRGVPNNGLHYGLRSYLACDDETAAGSPDGTAPDPGDARAHTDDFPGLRCASSRLRQLPAAQVIFNYLGQLDQTFIETPLFTLADEYVRTGRDPQWVRSYEFAINVDLYAGRLRVEWDYSGARYRHETILQLAGDYLETLRALIRHCLSAEAGAYTPSDFPLAGLSQAELDALFRGQQGIEDVYPLTAVQTGMLFHSRYAPEEGLYVQQVSCTLEGQLDRGAFVRAWQAVIDKHPVLRTAFMEEGYGRPLQVVHRQVGVPLVEKDWRGVSPARQAQRWRELLDADRRQGFDFSRAPLMRLILIRCGEEGRYRFLWSHHHALLDGWCPGLIFKDVLQAYAALRKGQPVALAGARPYRDYVAWLEQQDRETAAAYWRRALAGVSAPTPLGINRPIRTQRSQYAEQCLSLSTEVTRALSEFAKRHQLTLNTLVQGAWALLLSHYGSEREVIFGVTVAGRPAELVGVESMVGLFINTLPLRVTLPPRAGVVDWLQGLMRQNAELRQYEYSSLVDVHGCSEMARTQPLFESIVVFENYPVERALQGLGEDFEIRELVFNEQTHYPLTLVGLPGEWLELRLAYDRRRFDERAIRRLLGHLKQLLTGLVNHPTACLSELSIITQPERQQLALWQRPAAQPTPVVATLTTRFEAVVARQGKAVALVSENARLSYAELNARANQLAHHLRIQGVGPEDRIGLCMRRGPSLVIGIVGILKTGAAYVPLDPEYPPARLQHMIADAGVALVLTESALTADLTHCRTLLLDRDAQLIAQQSCENLCPTGTPAMAAYVIYTSGSTGRPKGVVVSHRNVVRLFDATGAELGFNGSDVWTLFHSHAFDFSVWEIWGALLYGGRLVVVPQSVTRAPEDLHRLIREQGITVLNQTPSSFYQLDAADAEQAAGLSPLRLVIFGGEALDLRRLHGWFARYGDQRPELVNMYGITETTIHVTLEPLTKARARGQNGSVIGRPLLDLETVILDRYGHPVPVGVPGEFYVGGEGLARGYLGQPGLTAERFVPNPFSLLPGARLYRTGDLARYLDNGTIEYLGRLDQQVKIRGYRIELGEIEAHLLAHPQVKDACVVVREDRPGDQRLIAYIVSPGASLGSEDLRAYLKGILPDYMVPSLYVFMGALPLTPNGKQDRKALPAPELDLQTRCVAPRNPLEQRLAAVFAEVLGVERVGIYDDFFELGGHSLTATQAMGRINKAFPVKLPLQSLFERSTVAELAGAVAQALIEHIDALPEEEVQRLLAETQAVETEHVQPS
ncbi:MAG: amino acid adenylation domain-containing protein [Gammaproteobacteria bacterium]